ncbi:MAG: hypothetical protein CSA62_06715 [Planctomycetota bacterium]|nr:MAG: hypothetical protein CSA62_06715 [Planctomycetota bacterium]
MSQPSEYKPGSAESGTALVIAIFFTILGLGLILSGSMVMEAASKKSEVLFRLDGQARQFANAGLIDAVSWFRRQTTQPVTSFLPVLDTTASPPVLDTDDPAIGIVRQFEISRGIWGRYEVRRFVPNVVPSEAETDDISAQRGAASAGTIWRLVSRGFVFRMVDPSADFNVQPNQVLSTEVMETEIRRMTLSPPSQAALCVDRADNCRINSRGRVLGGVGAGVAYPSSTGGATVVGELSGSPSLVAVGSYDSSVDAVFGLDDASLRSLADDRITSNAEFPCPVPNNHVLYVDADLVFTLARPLKGTGIIYVNGDVKINPGSNTFFNGMLYVNGDLTVNAPSILRGTFIVKGVVTVQGLADYAEIEYDDGILNSLMLEVGQYRVSSSVRRTDLRGSVKQ